MPDGIQAWARPTSAGVTMSTLNLESIFSPKSIAVIGVGRDPSGVGRTIFQNLIASGFEGPLYPVNLRKEMVQGVKAYPTVGKIPEQVDLAVIATPAPTVPELVDQCGRVGTKGLIVVSAGFGETGEDGGKLEEEVLRSAQPYGVRILGPNCLGVIVPHLKLNASFSAKMPQDGHVALVSQSGALCTALVEWANHDHFGFSHFVSVGGMLDIDFGDLIDYFGSDGRTRSIILYIESVTNARKFLSASRAFSRTKPIVALKSGRYQESIQAAISHTGAMAGEDLIYEAALQRAGIVRVEEISDLFNCSQIIAKQHNPSGPRLAIVTNAGGPGIMGTDFLLQHGGELAHLSSKTVEELDLILPPFWSRGNPVDVLGDASAERYQQALERVIEDPGVDGVLVILTPQAMTQPAAVARVVGQAAERTRKPVVASWMGVESVREGIEMLNRCGIPTYPTPEQAVKTFTAMYSYVRNLELLYETPKDISADFVFDKVKVRTLIEEEESDILTEPASKSLLEAYGIPVVAAHAARSPKEAISIARRIGYPVVLKVLSPEISHKSDAGGMLLGLDSDVAVKAGYTRILEAARTHYPSKGVHGVTVQKMIREKGYEVILGAKRDPVFGTVLLFGMGGVAAEIFQDRAVSLPPLSERLAQRLLESIKGYTMLRGFRNKPPVNLNLLKEILIRLSYLVVDFPAIEEMDINPLLIGPTGAWALDARIVIDREAPVEGGRPYSHLAIHPYPEEYVRTAELTDGTQMVLRPIRPEDVPLWYDLLKTFSRQTIRFRYFAPGKAISHEMAVRNCFIDYEKELSIVAGLTQENEKKLVGIGNVVFSSDLQNADLAVVVGDPWQGRGVGSHLMDFCIEIARQRGVRRIMGDMLPENRVILEMAKRRGFELKGDGDAKKGVLDLSGSSQATRTTTAG